MNRKSLRKIETRIGLLVCLSLVCFNFGCAGLVKNPFRDYAEKPFSSADWLNGDEVERGRMYADLFSTRSLNGKSRDEILQILGEPEKKTTIEDREVWLYRVEHSYNTPMKYFPVSFDSKKGAFAGSVRGGTISFLAKG